jgi:hypothetical protein
LYLNSEFKLTIDKKGTIDTNAFLNLGFNIKLSAKLATILGNNVVISVDTSNIVRTSTNFTLLEDWSSGSNNKIGDQFDWGNSEMIDNKVPLSPLIVSFADVPIYHYAMFITNAKNEKEYILHPTPNYDIPKFNKVLTITGFINVTITDGVNPPELYTNIVSVYDFLDAVKTSLIINVDTPFSDSRLFPDGFGGLLFPLRTSGYALPIKFTETDQDDISVILLVPPVRTETIQIYAYDVALITQEKWKVKDSTGEIGELVTGIESVIDGRFRIKINPKLPDVTDPNNPNPEGTIDWEYTPSDPDNPAPVSVTNLFLGSRATSKTFTFVYAKIPPVQCTPPNPGGYIDPACLGLPLPITEPSITMDPALQTRLLALHSWCDMFAKSNTNFSDDPATRNSLFQDFSGFFFIFEISRINAISANVSFEDINLMRRIVSLFHANIVRLYKDGSSPAEIAAGALLWDTALLNMINDFSGLIGLSGVSLHQMRLNPVAQPGPGTPNEPSDTGLYPIP